MEEHEYGGDIDDATILRTLAIGVLAVVGGGALARAAIRKGVPPIIAIGAGAVTTVSGAVAGIVANTVIAERLIRPDEQQ